MLPPCRTLMSYTSRYICSNRWFRYYVDGDHSMANTGMRGPKSSRQMKEHVYTILRIPKHDDGDWEHPMIGCTGLTAWRLSEAVDLARTESACDEDPAAFGLDDWISEYGEP